VTRSLADRQTLQAAQAIKAQEKKASKRARPAMVVKANQNPRVRDNEHLKRIRRLPCLATLIQTGRESYGVDAAHVRSNYAVAGWGGNPGLQSKPDDWRTLPLKHDVHMLQHTMNEQAFWAALYVHPPTICAALRDAPDFDAMLTVIRSAAAIARRTMRGTVEGR
jgi:hypothetical protein